MADSQELFTATLDAAEEYISLQQALGEALRAGFLSLAQARYSMGADRVSSLQYPSHMTAAARVMAAVSGELVLAMAEPGTPIGAAPSPRSNPSASGSWTVAAADTAAAVAGQSAGPVGEVSEPASAWAVDSSADANGPTANAEHSAVGSESVEQQLQRLRLAALQSDNLMEQLAAKYGCDGSSTEPSPGGRGAGETYTDDEEYAEVAKPGRPLHWFGSLVAPSLRDAEGHFGRALALVVQTANVQRRLRQDMESYRAVHMQQQQQQASSASLDQLVAASGAA